MKAVVDRLQKGDWVRRLLTRITRNRPMKSIDLDGVPYLERYYMGGFFGYQVWLHRFMSADSERHLHSHPWTAISVVLAGWYVEELKLGARIKSNFRKAWGLPARITPSRVHRIESAAPQTWTLMLVGRSRVATWKFIDEKGRFVGVNTSPADWWRTAGRRSDV